MKYTKEIAKKRSKVKLLHLIASFLIYFIATLPFHEYSHFIVLLALGGEGYIYLNYVIVEKLPDFYFYKLLVYSSGGLLTSLFYLIIRIFEEDPEDKIILTSISFGQLGYGIIEGYWFYTSCTFDLHLVGSITILIITTSYLVYKIISYKNKIAYRGCNK